MQAASVQGPQRAVLGSRQGSISPFTKGPVRFLLHLTRSPRGVVKSGGHGPGIVRVVVVRVAVGVDKAEIVRVARIDGTAPDIGRRQRVRRPATRHVIRDTPKNDLFSFPVAFQNGLDQFVFPVDLLSCLETFPSECCVPISI